MLGSTSLAAVGSEAGLNFEEFFRAEYPDLARACYLLTGDSAEAEDLAQEAMARAFERWDRVRSMDSPAGYLYGTAFNLNRKRIRRLAVRARRTLAEAVARDPADLAVTKNDVIIALASLPETQRQALILVGWFGMDTNEAGRILGIDPASVRGRVHRARIALRSRSEEEEQDQT
jgi:RNA polymerase sigma factor (sigma-70 family)